MYRTKPPRRIRPRPFRRLFVEALELRLAPATVNFINPAGGDWGTVGNWSNGRLPSASDNVVINFSGVTVTDSEATVSISSIQSQAALDITTGSFDVEQGASSIGASLTIASGVSLLATGIETSFTASGATTADGASLFAESGATLSLPGLTTFSAGSQNVVLAANGLNTKLDLSKVTTWTGPTADFGVASIQALSGGTVDLSGVTSASGGTTAVSATNSGSVVDLSALTTFSSNTSTASSLQVQAGGTIRDAKLTSLDDVSLTTDGTGSLDTAQITSLTNGTINTDGGDPDYSNLTDADGTNLYATGNATLALPALTSYTGNVFNGVFQSTGGGSLIDLSHLKTFHGPTFQFAQALIKSQSGGTVNLSGLTTYSGGSTEVYASGLQSVVDLSSLTSFFSDAGDLSVLQADQSGTIRDANLTTLNDVSLTYDGTGTLGTSQMTSFTNGTITVNSGIVPGLDPNFAGLTDADGTNLYVSGNATLALPALVSYTGNTGNGTFQASESGLLKLSNLKNLHGPTYTFSEDAITAESGGTIDLGSVTAYTGGATDVLATGQNSVVDLATLTSFLSDAANTSTLQATTGGTILDTNMASLDNVTLTYDGTGTQATAQMTSFTNGTITVNGGAPNFSSLTDADGTNLNALGSATLALPALTSYTGNANSGNLRASGQGAVLNLSNVTTLHGPTTTYSTETIIAISFGQVDLSGVTSDTGGVLAVSAQGHGVLNLSALASFFSDAANMSFLEASVFGLLLDGHLTTLNNVSLTLDGSSTIGTAQIASFTNGVLSVSGANPDFSALTDADGSSLNASLGATVTLPNLTSYTLATGTETFEAIGIGTVLSLPNLGSVSIGNPFFNAVLQVEAGGGLVSLPALAQITTDPIQFYSSGTGSVLDISGLESIISGPDSSFDTDQPTLNATQGGTVRDAALTTLNGVTLTVDGTDTISTAQITSFTNGTINVSGGTPDFSGLTAANGTNVFVSGGATVALPGLTSYQGNDGNGPSGNSFQASGAGSVLDLSHLTTWNGPYFSNGTDSFTAQGGGMIILTGLTNPAGNATAILADGSGSVVDLSNVTNYAIGTGFLGYRSSLQVTNGGTIRDANLTSLDSVDLTLDGSSTISTSQITSFTNGTITVNGGNPDFSGVTDADGTNFYVTNGATLALPALTSYTENTYTVGFPGTQAFQASGVDSLLDLSSVETILGLTGTVYTTYITAEGGSEVNLFGLITDNTGVKTVVQATGVGSIVDLNSLTSLAGTSLDISTLESDTGGFIQMTTGTLSLQYATVTVTSAGTINVGNPTDVGTLDLGTKSTLTGTGTLQGNVDNGGSVSPGSPTGQLTITGNYIQTSAGALDLTLDGLAQSSFLSVDGSATVGGALNVTLGNGYMPALGDAFQVMGAAPAVFEFSSSSGLNVGHSVYFEPSATADNLYLDSTNAPGPAVSLVTPSGTVNTTVSSIDVSFNTLINLATFTSSQITLTGLGGAIPVQNPAVLSAENYGIGLPGPLPDGNYTLQIAPQVADLLGNHLGQTFSETFTVNTTATFINPNGGSWDTPSNWSNGTLPTAGQRVVINFSGVTVTESLGDVTIASIQSAAALDITTGRFEVTSGSSSVGAALTVASGAFLTADGEGTFFTASGSTVADGASLIASNGATLTLPELTSYAAPSGGGYWYFQATGPGGTLSLPNLTTMGTLTGGYTLYVEADQGGQVDLPKLTSISSTAPVQFSADGSGSEIDLSALTALTAATRADLLLVTNNATILDGKLTTLNGVEIDLDGTGTLATNQWSAFNNGNVTLTGGVLSLSGVNLDGSSLYVSSGGQLMLPTLTSYAASNNTFRADGTGSVLDVSALANVTQQGTWEIDALNGGSVNLSGLASLTSTYSIDIEDTGGSTINLSGLTSLTSTVSYPSNITINDFGGSTLLDSKLTSLKSDQLAGIYVSLDGTDAHVADSWTSFTDSNLIIDGGSYTLAGLTDIDGSSLFVSAGSLALPGVTTVVADFSTFQAGGAGSVLDLSALTSVTQEFYLVFNANNGGELKLSGLTSLTQGANSNAIGFSDTGGSTILDGKLTNLNGVAVTVDGTDAHVADSWTTFAGSFTLTQGSDTLSNLTNVNFSALLLGGGSTLNLPDSAAVVTNSGDMTIGAGSTLNVAGNFMLTSGSTLDEQIGGTTASGLFGQVDIGGSAALAGDFNLELVNGIPSATGPEYPVLKYSSAVGSFAVIGGLPSGMVASQNATEFDLDASVVTWINPNGGDWGVATNWSTGVVPTTDDNVEIDYSGITITESQASVSILSIQSQAFLDITTGTFQVTAGSSVINAALLVGSGATLEATGTGTSFAATGTTIADGATLTASGGATLSLPELTSYNYTGNFGETTLLATGIGSTLNLSGLTSLATLGPQFQNTIDFQAQQGGQILLPVLSSVSPANTSIFLIAEGAGSQISIADLTQFNALGGKLQAIEGGTILDSSLTTLSNVNVTLDGTGTVATSQWTTLTGGSITASAGSYTFSSLTDFDSSSLIANGSATISAPSLASYNYTGDFNTTFLEASGTGSMLNLPALTSLATTGPQHTNTIDIEALQGGQVSLPFLFTVSPVNTSVSLIADGAGSQLHVGLTHFNALNGDVQASNNGTITAAGLTTLNDAKLIVNGGTLVAPLLTNVNGSSIEVSGGSTITLLNVISYSLSASPGVALLEASGPGSVLSLPNLGSVSVTTTAFDYLQIQALSGGTITLPALTQVNPETIEFESDGTGSVLNVSALTTFDGPQDIDHYASSLQVTHGGQVKDAALTSVNAVTLTLDGSGTLATAQITSFTNGVVTDSGGDLDFLDLTNANGTSLSTSGSDIQLTNGTLNLIGGTINLTGGTINVGTLNLGANSSLAGTFTLAGNVFNGGSVSPGLMGLMTITGNYTQTAAGALDFTIDGLQAGTQYSQLAIDGSATFGGALNATVGNGFALTGGDSFLVMTFASASGSFSNISGLQVSQNLDLDQNATATSLTLTPNLPSQLPNTVTFTNPNGGSWDTASNWSTGAIPVAGDNVVINYSGVTVTESEANVSIASIQSRAALDITTGDFHVTEGSSTINAALTVGSGATLEATGAGTSFTATGATTADGASLYAEAGATLSLPQLESYNSDGNTFQADGTNSVLDVSALTTIAQQGGWDIDASNGGTVKLLGLSSLTGTRGITINDSGGSTLLDGNLTSLNGVNITLDGSDTQAANSWTSFINGQLSVTGGLYNLPGLTDVDGTSLRAQDGGILALPKLISYSSDGSTFQADDMNSVLDVSALTTITQQGGWDIDASNGGTVKLLGLTSLTGTRGITINDTGGSTLLDGNLTSLNGVNITLDGSDTQAANSWTSFINGQLSVTGGLYNLPGLTDVDGTSLRAQDGGILALPKLISYSSDGSTFQADDMNSVLDVSALTTITQQGGWDIDAANGGTVKLLGLSSLTSTRGITINDTGGSTLLDGNLTSLSGVNITLDGSDTQAANSWTSFINGQLSVTGGLYNLPGLTDVDGTSLRAQDGGILALPKLISYSSDGSTFQADDMNSVLDVSALTTITQQGGWDIDASNGGTVKLLGLTSLTGTRGITINDTGGSTLLDGNLTSLNGVNITLDGSDTQAANSWTSFINGQLTVTGGLYNLPGLTDVDGTSLRAQDGGILALPKLISYSSDGSTFQADDMNSVLDVSALTTITQQGGWDIDAANGGTVKLLGLSSLTSTKGITITDTGGTLNLTGGNISLKGVTIDLESSGTITAGTLDLGKGSTLTGTGTITANVVNGGTVNPGDPTGQLTINGNYTQTSAGALNLTLDSLNQYSQLAIVGSATFGGSLNAQLGQGFTPTGGDTFQFMTFSSSAGDFSSTSGLQVGQDLEFNPSATALNLTLTATPNRPLAVTNITPSGTVNTAVSTINVTFNALVNLSTFTTSQITLTGPNGAIAVQNPTPASGDMYAIDFVNQLTPGAYTLNISGPVSDLVGNTLANGSYQDVFTISLPDLVANSISGPSNADFGQSIPISWIVTNSGPGTATGPWTDEVWLSQKTTLDSSAISLTTLEETAEAPLAPNQPYTIRTNVALPYTLISTTGTYYLLLETNATNSMTESNTTNNVAVSSPFVLSIPPEPNLVVTTVSAPPAAFGSSQVVVSWTDQNNGTAAANGPWVDHVFAATDAQGDNPTPVGTFTYPDSLAPGASVVLNQLVTLPSAPGTYWLMVTTNATGTVTEGPYASNSTTLATAPTIITQAPLPDLVADSIIGPSSADFDQTISISWTVTNASAGAATGPWTDEVWLSQKTTLDSSAISLTSLQETDQAPLLSSQDYTIHTNVTLPLTVTSTAGTYYLTAGTYYLIVQTNATNSLTETNTTNDVAVSSPLVLSFPPEPNLVVTSVTAPATGLDSAQNLISWTDQNVGTATANGPWVDYVYVATDAQGDDTTILSRFTYPDSLAPGAAVTLTKPVALPATPGPYWFVITTNAMQTIYEGPYASNPTAISATPTVEQQVPSPDLVVTSITPPPNNILSGTSVPISFIVTNNGQGPTSTPNWNDYVILSQDPTLGQAYNGIDNTILNNQPVIVSSPNPSYLAPGESYEQTVNVTLPVNAQGTWYVYVVPDALSQMPEVSRIDKLAISNGFNIVLTPPANLAVTTVQAPSQDFSGQAMNLTWTVTNIGNGPTLTNTWTDAVYMSTTPTLDSSAILLGYFGHQGTLITGGSYTTTESVTLPNGFSGTFYFLVETGLELDPQNGQLVVNGNGQFPLVEIGPTTDNVGSSVAANVNLTPPPDLEIETISAPTTALAGHDLDFTYTVTNVGAGPTPNYTWNDSFSLSPTPTYNEGTAIPLGQATHQGSLDAGDGYSDSVTVTPPNGLSGVYYLLVDVDSTKLVFELDRSNNWGSSDTIQILSQPADLAVTAPSLTTASGSATAMAGTAVLVNWTVTNIGAGDTEVSSWQDFVYASGDSTPLGMFQHDGLLSGDASYKQTQLVTLPLALSSGPYNLFVVTNEPIVGSTPPVYETNTGNDTSTAVPITIVQQLADLQVVSVTAPTTAATGESATVDWTVENFGVATTNSNYWYDDVWLSTNPTLGSGGTDVYLGTKQHTNPLAGSATYSMSGTFTLPQTVAAGNYYFIVATDRPVAPPITGGTEGVDLVYQNTYSNSELAASGTAAVTIGPTPELSVSNVVVQPATATSGQTLSVSWILTNSGSAAVSLPITANVYLTYDTVFDTTIDLGPVTYNDGLAAGGSDTQTAILPLKLGTAGIFYVFVETNSNGNIYEQSTPVNAVAIGKDTVNISLPPPVDLGPGTISTPATGFAGMGINISYAVSNNSANTADGSWQDNLYLSPTTTWSVSDPLLETVPQTRNLGPDASYEEDNLIVPLPGVLTPGGTYYVILRPDALDNLSEMNLLNNNYIVSNSFTIDAPPPPLTLGTPQNGTLEQSQSAYYEVIVPPGQTMQVTLNSQDPAAANELYVSYGTMPTRSQYDYSYSQPFGANQQITIPTTQAGDYYILAYADDVSDITESYTITAALVPFSVQAVTPGQVGAGPVTLTIDGAQFGTGTKFQLQNAAGAVVNPTRTLIQDSATAYVTFDLTGQALGTYNVVAIQEDNTSTMLAGAVTVVPATPNTLQLNLIVPQAELIGRPGTIRISYANNGNTDLPAQLVFVDAQNALFQIPGQSAYESTPLQLQLYTYNPVGPFGTLPPGFQGSITVSYEPISTGIGVTSSFSLETLQDSTEAFDWNAFATQDVPLNTSPQQWAAMVAQAAPIIGSTWAEVASFVGNNKEMPDGSLLSSSIQLLLDAGPNSDATTDAGLYNFDALLQYVIGVYGAPGPVDPPPPYSVIASTGSVTLYNANVDSKGNPIALDDTQQTFLIVTDWQGYQDSDGALAQALAADGDANVLLATWQTSGTNTPWDAALQVNSAGQSLAAILDSFNQLNRSTLTIIGDGFGAYVANQAGKGITGLANIVALNPPSPFSGYLAPNLQQNFQNSTAFETTSLFDAQASIAGSNQTLDTGDDNNPIDIGQSTFGVTWLTQQILQGQAIPGSSKYTPGPDIVPASNNPLPLSVPASELLVRYTANVAQIAPIDPNNILGPKGSGSNQYVANTQPLPYTITFTNVPTASAPAQQITITDKLDPNLNWAQFRLGSFGFGGLTFQVPANTSFYQTTLNLKQLLGFDVNLTATIDERTGIATWLFSTVDAVTGQVPLNPLLGLLPPDNSAGVGEGFVSYTIMASQAAVTGAVVAAQATVAFDTQPPLMTPQIFNTVDTGLGLQSSVSAIPNQATAGAFNVTWTGSDADNGSAVSSYNIYVSDNGAPYTPWLDSTSLTDATYLGVAGNTYSFFSVAIDNAGNIQPSAGLAQAVAVIAPSSGNSGEPGTGNGGTQTTGNGGTQTTGNGGAQTTGNGGTQTTGNGGTQTTGNGGTQPTGSGGTQPTGNSGTQSTGNSGTQNTGNSGEPSTGNLGAQGTGNSGASATGNSASSPGNGLASTAPSSSLATSAASEAASSSGSTGSALTSGTQASTGQFSFFSTVSASSTVVPASGPTGGIELGTSGSSTGGYSTPSGIVANNTSIAQGAGGNGGAVGPLAPGLQDFISIFSTPGVFVDGILFGVHQFADTSWKALHSSSLFLMPVLDPVGLEPSGQRLLLQGIGDEILGTILDAMHAVGNALPETTNQARKDGALPPAPIVGPENQDEEQDELSQQTEMLHCDTAFIEMDGQLLPVPTLGLDKPDKEEKEYEQLFAEGLQPVMRPCDAAFSRLDGLLGVALFVAGGYAGGRELQEHRRRRTWLTRSVP